MIQARCWVSSRKKHRKNVLEAGAVGINSSLHPATLAQHVSQMLSFLHSFLLTQEQQGPALGGDVQAALGLSLAQSVE